MGKMIYKKIMPNQEANLRPKTSASFYVSTGVQLFLNKIVQWSAFILSTLNFSRLTDRNQIFMNDSVCIQCHLCKISP